MIRYDPFWKRVFDRFVSTVAITLLSPIFILIAILIKADSEGPVLFRQIRVGKNFRQFCLIKFRTMTCENNAEKLQFEAGSTSRVTRIGSFLRATKLDELPELFNIIKGDMSIIGPRPEVPKYVKVFKSDYRKILSVRPGLSDSASIKYRNEEDILWRKKNPERHYVEVILPDKLELAKGYAEDISFKKDVRIIIQTLRCIV